MFSAPYARAANFGLGINTLHDVSTKSSEYGSFWPEQANETASGITLKGALPNAAQAFFRYDAKSGQIYGTMTPYYIPLRNGYEWPMGKVDMQALEGALRAYMKATPGRQPVHEKFNSALRAAIAKAETQGSFVNAATSKPASVAPGGIKIVNGNDKTPTAVEIRYNVASGAHQLAYEVGKEGHSVTIRIADYDNGAVAYQMASRKIALINLGVLSKPVAIKVVNQNGSELFGGATPAT